MSTDTSLQDGATGPEPDEPPPPTASLTRHGDFNKLWLGQAISAFGSEVTTLALPLTAIIYLEASATQLGVMAMLRDLAFLGPMLFFGVLVDRMRRRPLMVAADLGRFLLIGMIPVLAFMDSLTMMALYIAALGIGCFSVIFDLAYRSYLPGIVTREQLMAGNSRLQATDSLSQITGPGIAGVLVQVLRAPFALAIDAVSFLVSAVSIMSVRKKEPPIERTPEDLGRGWRGVFTDIGQGLKITVRHPVIRALAGNSATFNFFSVLMLTLFVLYATREMGLSPAALGAIFAAFGVGGLLGALSLGKLLGKLGYGRLLIFVYILAVVPIMAIPLVDGPPLVSGILFGVIHFIVGFGIVGSNIAEMTFRQLIVPQNILGRVNASFRFLIGGLVPIAGLVAGLLGDWIGLRPTLVVTAVGIPLSLIWLIASPIPKLRTVEDAERVAA